MKPIRSVRASLVSLAFIPSLGPSHGVAAVESPGPAADDPGPAAAVGDNGACCNTLTGECVDGQTECPPDWVFQGLGTDCVWNCCPQPMLTGGDNCADAVVRMIDVPPPGSPPLTVTISGDDSPATGGDGCPDWTPAFELWWEAFHLDDCARITLDFCCRDLASQPFSLRRACPCSGTIPWTISCPDSECWSCYHSAGPLPAGTFYVPMHRQAAERGGYQMHLRVTPCALAACCLPAPVCRNADGSLARGGDGSPVFCPNGDECAAGTTCASECAELNELDCKDVNGYWLHESNTGAPSVTDCATDRCGIGSCCLGPEQCEDTGNLGVPCDPGTHATCMDQALCDSIGGSFVGGALCNNRTNPCRVCELERYNNCQPGYPSDGYVRSAASDRTLMHDSIPREFVAADDFVPAEATLSGLCVQGMFLNVGGEGTSPDCGPAVANSFRVRVYADDPVQHAPGTLLAERWATVDGQAYEATDPRDVAIYRTQLSFDSVNLTPGLCHWLEVSDSPVYTGGDLRVCDWYWTTRVSLDVARNGNEHSVARLDSRNWQPMEVDLAFCLDIPFDEGGCGTVTGTCCACADGTCSVGTQRYCRVPTPDVTWDSTVDDCGAVTCDITIPPGDTCQTVGDTCPAGGTCVGGLSAGDPCTRGSDCRPGGGCNCAPNGPILLEPDFLESMALEFTTNCATTDGPDPMPSDTGTANLTNDLWFRYVVSGPSYMVVNFDTCATVGMGEGGFDSWIAVYHDAANPTVCPPCPTTNEHLYLWPASTDGSSDEGCNPEFWGGGGIVRTAGWLSGGECFLIRVGRWGPSDAQGHGFLTITATHVDLAPPPPPEPVMFDFNPGPTVNLVPLSVQRMLPIRVPGSAGRSQAIRVHFKSLPPPWDVWNGTKLFLKEPVEVCEVTGLGPGGSCAANIPRFYVSRLTCDPAAAAYRDWTTVVDATVFASHPGIVPSGPGVPAEYEVQAIEAASPPMDEASYSPPLRLTQPRWGDVVGPFDVTSGYYVASDGAVDVALDVTAAINKFGNRPGSPRKYRVEVEPCISDFKINVTDVVRILDGFRNLPYPFSPTGGFGCNSADPCSYGP